MERRRARLEALAQVTAHDYDLALNFGPKAKNGEDAIHVEDPEQTLARLGGGLNDEHVLRFQKGMTLIEVAHKIHGTFRWAGRAALANRERPGLVPHLAHARRRAVRKPPRGIAARHQEEFPRLHSPGHRGGRAQPDERATSPCFSRSSGESTSPESGRRPASPLPSPETCPRPGSIPPSFRFSTGSSRW